MLGPQLQLDSIDVKIELADNLPQVMAHHNRLIQVIYNIMINAKEAIDTKRAANGFDENHWISLRSFYDKGRVYVDVADSGVGLSEHMHDRVFEPFFTTKAKGHGKGLGLTICKQIVRDCKGRIAIASLPNGGAVITLYFPVMSDK
jgi:C4-dicarboxylate-specific signal transduction histidine kinase